MFACLVQGLSFDVVVCYFVMDYLSFFRISEKYELVCWSSYGWDVCCLIARVSRAVVVVGVVTELL